MKNVIIKITNNEFDILEHHGFNRYDINGGIYLSFSLNENLKQLIDKEFLLNMKGLFISKEKNIINIYGDIFRTVPLYYITKNNETYIFSDFESIKKYIEIEKNIDPVGFWEYLLFGNGIYNRTIYENVKQFTVAGQLLIENNLLTFDYYWDFSIYENNSYNYQNEKEVINIVQEKLISIFNNELQQKNDHYTLGLSGGMDSRLAFAILKKLNLLDNTKFFTYGYNKNILESLIAQKLLKLEKLSNWSFHKLIHTSYTNALNKFAKFTAASVSFAHSHIYDYLDNQNAKNFISTYYSDAIFGYSTENKKNDTYLDVDYFISLEIYKEFIPQKILTIINDDIRNSLKNYNTDFNYSSINEYKYIIERHTKFHMNLLFIQSQKASNVLTPFANFELFEVFISLPIKYRINKKIIVDIIKNIDYKYINDVEDSSSKKVYFEKTFNNIFKNFDNILILSRKILNIILFNLTRGRLFVFDKNSTEIQAIELIKNYQNDLNNASNFFNLKNLINDSLSNKLKKVPSHGKPIAIRYQLIDLYRLLEENNEKN
ncbi:MAG: hypothetical protein JXQ67_08755 [Campylobacterales bacterium]|nr:hypothetical protein [Campylobacterales bacterium]